MAHKIVRSMQNTLTRFIRELLTEEVFGRQAFVYHGSNTKPEDMLKILANNDFKPGNAAGAMYGRGLYTVYDIDPNLPTFSGDYGVYLYKLKINIDNFIIFDSDVCKKVYGEVLSPLQQLEKHGMKDAIKEIKSKKLTKVAELMPAAAQGPIDPASRFTSDFALKLSPVLQIHVKGMVYTGRRDGKVALIYDANDVVPVSWAEITKGPDPYFVGGKRDSKLGTWRKFSQKDIESSISRSVDAKWKSGRHFEYKSEDIITAINKGVKVFNGNIRIDQSMLDQLQYVPLNQLQNVPLAPAPGATGKVLAAPRTTKQQLPDNLHVKGDLAIFSNTASASSGVLRDIPNNLTVDGNFDVVYGDYTKIGTGLHVKGNAKIRGNIACLDLPDDMIVDGDLEINFALNRFPNIKIGGDLYWSGGGSRVKNSTMDDNCVFHKNVKIVYTPIKKLPANMYVVNGDLNLEGCYDLQKLPDNLTVHGNLTLPGYKEGHHGAMHTLPKGLTVDGDLTGCWGDTRVTLPDTVVGGKIVCINGNNPKRTSY